MSAKLLTSEKPKNDSSLIKKLASLLMRTSVNCEEGNTQNTESQIHIDWPQFSKIVCPTAIEFLDKIESPQLKARFVCIFSIMEIARSVETHCSFKSEADLFKEMKLFITQYYLPFLQILNESRESSFSLSQLIVNLVSKSEARDPSLIKEPLTTLIGNNVDLLKYIILADGLDERGKNEFSSMLWNRRIDLNAISTFFYSIVMKIYPAKYSSSHWFRFDVSPENRYSKQLVQIQKDDM